MAKLNCRITIGERTRKTPKNRFGYKNIEFQDIDLSKPCFFVMSGNGTNDDRATNASIRSLNGILDVDNIKDIVNTYGVNYNLAPVGAVLNYDNIRINPYSDSEYPNLEYDGMNLKMKVDNNIKQFFATEDKSVLDSNLIKEYLSLIINNKGAKFNRNRIAKEVVTPILKALFRGEIPQDNIVDKITDEIISFPLECDLEKEIKKLALSYGCDLDKEIKKITDENKSKSSFNIQNEIDQYLNKITRFKIKIKSEEDIEFCYKIFEESLESISEFAKTIVNKIIYNDDGVILPIEQIAKRARNINILTCCYGSQIDSLLMKAIKSKLDSIQFFKTEDVKLILEQIVSIEASPFNNSYNNYQDSVYYVLSHGDNVTKFHSNSYYNSYIIEVKKYLKNLIKQKYFNSDGKIKEELPKIRLELLDIFVPKIRKKIIKEVFDECGLSKEHKKLIIKTFTANKDEQVDIVVTRKDLGVYFGVTESNGKQIAYVSDIFTNQEEDQHSINYYLDQQGNWNPEGKYGDKVGLLIYEFIKVYCLTALENSIINSKSEELIPLTKEKMKEKIELMITLIEEVIKRYKDKEDLTKWIELAEEAIQRYNEPTRILKDMLNEDGLKV